jgi:hypothetical protein
MGAELKHTCDTHGCQKDPSECFCSNCFDAVKTEAFEDGKKDGYDEGYAKGLEDGNSN